MARGIFPLGNIPLATNTEPPYYSRTGKSRTGGTIEATQQIGQAVRETRKRLGVTQEDLALTSGTGVRFIVDLEKGKPTCEIGKVLAVLRTLGIRVELTTRGDQQREWHVV